MPRVVVLGFGNPLRGDDGVGWRVAEATAERWSGRVVVRTGQQLVPEWAVDLTDADMVYFVDASLEVQEAELKVLSVESSTPIDTHDLTPAQLLHLTHSAFGRSPRGFVLHVPAINLDFGQTLSPAAARGVRAALCLLNTQIAVFTA